MPDRDCNVKDIVLGFDSIGSYISGSPYFGAIVSRFSNDGRHRQRGARESRGEGVIRTASTHQEGFEEVP